MGKLEVWTAPLVIMVAVCLFGVAGQGQTKPSTSNCMVEIVAPHPGDHVSETGQVSGTATIPSEDYLWVLAHKAGLNGWWPQGGGSRDISEGKWQATVFYGQPRDVGSNFEIVAVVVDDNNNTKLQQWVKDAPNSGYPPTEFPNTVTGCSTPKVIVAKTQ